MNFYVLDYDKVVLIQESGATIKLMVWVKYA